MADNREHQVAAIGRTDSNDSIILMTSSEPAVVGIVREGPGDLFDAPNGAALIRAFELLHLISHPKLNYL